MDGALREKSPFVEWPHAGHMSRCRKLAQPDEKQGYRKVCRFGPGRTPLQVADCVSASCNLASSPNFVWHMETLARICQPDPQFLLATPWRKVELSDTANEADATAWWETLTELGGEGMVVKPMSFVQKGRRDLAQPAVKCRGRE